jgi:hypothetical protein
MLKRLLITSILFVFIVGCSLYESSNRKAIENNSSGIVVLMNGIDKTITHYYVCSRSSTLPEFLKEPLEVIESPTASESYSVLLNESATPQWVVVYQTNVDSQTHDFCKIYMINQAPFNHSLVISAARLGVDKLGQLAKTARP